MAFPWGRHLTLVSGIVSQVNREAPIDATEPAPQLMVDASVSYGSSGGGMYEARRGRLVGPVDSYRTARVSLPGRRLRATSTCPRRGRPTSRHWATFDDF